MESPERSNCVFCRIIDGTIPSTVVYRDDDVVAIADVNPQAPTHLLAMPVRHFENAVDAAQSSAELLAKLFGVAARLGSERGPEGFRMVVNTGPQGGQTVDHLHVHILAGRQMHWPPG